MKQYLEVWYKSFEGVPWHDGHLVVNDECSAYGDYWAFEGAAIYVLYNIDDSSFRDHMVYPKDLADWAREHKVVEALKPGQGAQPLRMRCEGGSHVLKLGSGLHRPRQTVSRHLKQVS